MFPYDRYLRAIESLTNLDKAILGCMNTDESTAFLESRMKDLMEQDAKASITASEAAIAPRSFTITVNGQQGAGKTTLLIAIMQGLANAGLLNDADTFDAFTSPLSVIEARREHNGNMTESLDIKVRGDDLADYQSSLADAKPISMTDGDATFNGTLNATGGGIAFTSEFSADEIANHGWREAIATAAIEAIGEGVPSDTTEVMLVVRKTA